jgi:hypothetical protein
MSALLGAPLAALKHYGGLKGLPETLPWRGAKMGPCNSTR